MALPEEKMMSKTNTNDSVEIGAAGAMVQAAALPMMAVLLAEAEALAAIMPGTPLPEQAEPAQDADPFDNMPV
jgi:hypothetical protein